MSQLTETGRPMRKRTTGPALSKLGEGLAGQEFLVPSCSSDSLWQARHLQTDIGRQLNSVSSDTLVQLASGLSEQCGIAGSCFVSPESVRELQQWDKTITINWISQKMG